MPPPSEGAIPPPEAFGPVLTPGGSPGESSFGGRSGKPGKFKKFKGKNRRFTRGGDDEIPKQVTRTPPHDLAAERAVLGSVLLDNEAMFTAAEELEPTDFYHPVHMMIFKAMTELAKKSEPVDAVTISAILRQRDELESVGGLAAIISLGEAVPTAANVKHYAGIVKSKSTLRKLIHTATEVVQEAYESADTEASVDLAEKAIFDIAKAKAKKGLTPVSDIVADTFKMIEKLAEKKEAVTGVYTGIHDLDLKLSGLQPSDLVIVAGRPSMGKAQPLDAQVLTPGGFVSMGSLRVGDALASPDGAPSAVLGIFPQGELQIYRVRTSDGRATECCAEHLWTIQTPAGPRTETTAALQGRLGRGEKVELPAFSGEFGESSALPVAPQALGRWLRAGRKNAEVERALPGLRNKGDARIPPSYLRASRASRLALLQGLLLAPDFQSGRKTVRLSSAQMAEELLWLVRSLGGTGRLHAAQRRHGAAGQGPVQTVCSVVLPAEGARLNVVSIEPVRVAQAQCIKVSHPSALYVTDGFMVTHNTAFTIGVGLFAATEKNSAAAIFSLEMSKESLVQRMLCSTGRIDASRMRGGMLTEEDWPKLARAAGKLSEAPIYIDDTGAISILELRAKCRRLAADTGLDLVIVDYLQLMRGSPNPQSREQEISEISRGLKGLAKELSVPVVALSQLNRAVEQRADKRPGLADLRESGAIEQDADVIMFVYRDEVYNPETAERGAAEIIVGKQRNGPIGTVRARFMHEFTRFDNYVEDESLGAMPPTAAT